MFTTYKNQVETLIMLEDVNDGLELRDVKFTGEHVLEDGQFLYLETRITDADGSVTTNWIAMKDAELIFSDERPEGVQVTISGVI